MTKTILCYGDSNVWGFIPGSYNPVTCLAERYPKSKRWTGVLQSVLGEEYDVVEEAINGRTTSLDEMIPGRPYRNGLKDLPFCFEAHYPISLIILWLGTNDTKKQYDRSVEDIVVGIKKLITFAKESKKNPFGLAPKILVIAPQPIVHSPNLHEQYNEISIEKSHNLAINYQRIAEEEDCEFLNAAESVTSSIVDGVHLDADSSQHLGEIIAEKVKEIFKN